MFRVSPWISYDPSTSRNSDTGKTGSNDMNVDVDMDAPQISTLREEETPPPPAQARVSKFRVKLRVNEDGTPGSSGSSPRKPQPNADSDEDEDEEDDEEEEDQLADDDDLPLSVTPIPTTPAAPSRAGGPPKRGQGKGRGRGRGGRGKAAAPETGPMMSWFEVSPSGARDIKSSPQAVVEVVQPPPEVPSKPPRKKPVRKNPNPQRPGRKPGPKASKAAVQVQEDPGSNSEAFAGTAASSPIIRDLNTPELDALHVDAGSIPHLPSTEEYNMNSIPLPVYPLPSKPFLVQPLPKIGSGFAPTVPLDKSGAKVRHWRQAHREIRGIAGGRWFTRAWTGDKESDYAAVASLTSASSAQGPVGATEKGKDKDKPGSSSVSLPQLPAGAMPISIGSKGRSGKQKFVKPDGNASTAPSSRSGSVVPDIHIIRPPSKMRNILAAPDPESSNDVEGAPTFT